MATELSVPPSDDFTGFNGLVAKQGGYFDKMVPWAGQECADTDGLDGLLSLVEPWVKKASTGMGDKLKQCQTGMGTIQTKITTVDRDLRSTDEKNAAEIG